MQLGATRHIGRRADEVFAFFSDASNNPKWQTGMVSCEWTTPPPIDIGSRYTQVARFMGRSVESKFVVTEYEPGRLIAIETEESTFPIAVRRTVTPLDDSSCQVEAVIGGGPEKGPLRWLTPLVQRRAQKSVDADYDRLVVLLES